MKSIRIKASVFVLFALFMSASYAEETVISIGHQKIVIPELDDFDSVITTDEQILGFMDEMVPEKRKHLAYVIDKNILLSGTNTINIIFYIPVGTENNIVSKNDFLVLAERIKGKAVLTPEKVLTKKVIFSIGDIAPMGVFLENDRAIGFTNVYEENVEINGRLESGKSANAFIILLLKGRVLAMNIVTSFESMKDVDRLKRKAHIWSAQIIDANSKSPFFK